MPNGSNLDYLLNCYECQECHIAYFGLEILKGLKYRHDHSVVHRDVRPASAFVENDGAVRPAGFGQSADHDLHWIRPEDDWDASILVSE
jgi:serine/threonine protein kinase